MDGVCYLPWVLLKNSPTIKIGLYRFNGCRESMICMVLPGLRHATCTPILFIPNESWMLLFGAALTSFFLSTTINLDYFPCLHGLVLRHFPRAAQLAAISQKRWGNSAFGLLGLCRNMAINTPTHTHQQPWKQCSGDSTQRYTRKPPVQRHIFFLGHVTLTNYSMIFCHFDLYNMFE